MDYSYHIQQGCQLLDKHDASSIKKALEYFKAANEMTEEIDLAKPKTLYYLAFGNFIIGNIEQSYRIAHKAKRSIDTVMKNSEISMNSMRLRLGEGDIDELINRIKENFFHLILFTDIEDDDFDENMLDFAFVNKIYPTTEKQIIKPQFSISSLSEDVIIETFIGLCRTEEELIYFDKLKGDVLSYIEGYFTSNIGDQDVLGRILVNRIKNGEPNDFVDEDRYILIDRLLLSEFLNEYKKQANGKEPFFSFVEYYSKEVLKEYSDEENVTVDDLVCSDYMQKEFHKFFSRKYLNRIQELKTDYTNIFNNTCKSLAASWIRDKIFDGVKESM